MVGAAEDGLRAPRALDALGRGHGAPFAAPLDASRAARPAPRGSTTRNMRAVADRRAAWRR